MAGMRSPWYKRWILYRIPFLFKVGPCGNYHWRWDRLCFCRRHEHTRDWHGGIYDFKTGREYQDCPECTREFLKIWGETFRQIIFDERKVPKG